MDAREPKRDVMTISSRRKGREEPNPRLSTRLTKDWSKETRRAAWHDVRKGHSV